MLLHDATTLYYVASKRHCYTITMAALAQVHLDEGLDEYALMDGQEWNDHVFEDPPPPGYLGEVAVISLREALFDPHGQPRDQHPVDEWVLAAVAAGQRVGDLVLDEEGRQARLESGAVEAVRSLPLWAAQTLPEVRDLADREAVRTLLLAWSARQGDGEGEGEDVGTFAARVVDLVEWCDEVQTLVDDGADPQAAMAIVTTATANPRTFEAAVMLVAAH